MSIEDNSVDRARQTGRRCFTQPNPTVPRFVHWYKLKGRFEVVTSTSNLITMPKRVLDVGQCVPDHAAIRRLLETSFHAVVEQTHALDDTLARLRETPFDLVLVNRKIDIDYSDGLDILKAIKADPQLAEIPVMLVTNYPEHQQTAIAAGAEPGFGKDSLRSPQTVERLAKYCS